MNEGLLSNREVTLKGEIKGLGEKPFLVPLPPQRTAKGLA
jgi:hypothetical protein